MPNPDPSVALQEYMNIVAEIYSPILYIPQESALERFKSRVGHCLFFRSHSVNSLDTERSPLLHTPGMDSSQKNFSLWSNALGAIVAITSGIGGGWLFASTGTPAAELISGQIESFEWLQKTFGSSSQYVIDAIAEMIKICGVETNGILGLQVMIILIMLLRSNWRRSPAEQVLTGNINFKHWIVGAGAALGMLTPLTALAEENSMSTQAKIFTLLASIASLPAYCYGGQALLTSLFPNVFLETEDDSINGWSRNQIRNFRKRRNKMAGAIGNYLSEVLEKYQTSADKNTILDEAKTKLSLFNRNRSKENLSDYLSLLTKKPTSNNDRTNRIIANLGIFAKSSASAGIVTVCASMTIIDLLVAYYAGEDLINNNQTRQIMLSSLAMILTAVSSTGFSLSSIKMIMHQIWHGDRNIISTITPGTFKIIATLLIIGGVFSGGMTALAGFRKVNLMLQDLAKKDPANAAIFNSLQEWLPQVFEAIGFVGTAIVNIPYCLGWAQWALEMYAKLCGDKATRTLMQFVTSTQKLSEVTGKLKLGHVENLLNADGLFSDLWNNDSVPGLKA